VAAQHVQHVVAADRQAIAVPRHHPDVELGIGELDAGRNRRRAAVHGVESVRRHIVRKARGAPDPTDEYGALAHESHVGARLLHRLEDRVVAAAGTPADFLVRGVILGGELRVGDRGDRHTIFLIACAISVTRKGLPVTFGSDSAGTRYSARSSFTSWPLFISGTSTRSKRFSKSPRFRGNGLKYRT